MRHVQDGGRRPDDRGRGIRRALGREQREVLESATGQQRRRLVERAVAEADEPLTVYEGEVVARGYVRVPAFRCACDCSFGCSAAFSSASAGSGAPPGTPPNAFDSARR
jgi:hypothetical protein